MTPLPRPLLRDITDPADPALAAAHRLLTRNFTKAERVPLVEWRNAILEGWEGLSTDNRWHLTVAELGNQVVGLATGTYLGSVNVGVIGYLVVAATARGFGLGPLLRKRLRLLFTRDAKALRGEPLEAVMGEVRPDNPWLRTLVHNMGVIPLDFRYLQPGLHEDDEPVPLVLYYESLARVRRRLPATLLRQILFTSWRRIYRIAQPLSHAIFRQMLSDLDGRRSIGRLSPDALLALSSGEAQ
jgi:hypothetical protein